MCYDNAEFQSLMEEKNGFLVGSAGDVSDSLLYIGYLEQGYRFDRQKEVAYYIQDSKISCKG